MRTLKLGLSVSSLVLVGSAFAFLSGCAGGGSLESDSEVKAIAPTVDNNSAMGREVAKEIFRKAALISSDSALTYANTVAQYIGKSLVPTVKCPTAVSTPDQIRVAIVNSQTPSLYSVPGGLVFISTSYLNKVSTEDELASLIAREVVHSLCEHGVPADLPAQAADGWSGFIAKLPTAPLKREQQILADKLAVNALYRSGYELLPYVRYIEKNELEPRSRSNGGKERAALLGKMVSGAKGVLPNANIRKARFEKFKADCR